MISEIEIDAPVFASYQKAIIESPKRFTITEASTKCGKTFSHIFWLFELAHTGKEGYNYWWIAPIYSQAEIAFKRLMRKVAESGAYIINRSSLSITTPLGTVITFKTADNPNALYGENVYGFVFDEYSRAKEDAWFALRTTTSYTRAKGKFIGNVVARNWAWDLARKAEKGLDPDFEYFKVTAYQAVEAGILSADEVEQAKKDLPTRIFKMLYMADFSEVEGALWSWNLIDSTRVTEMPDFVRAAIALDPATTSNEGSDETGIIRGGRDAKGHIYICEDKSGIHTPQDWASIAIGQYNVFKLDKIVAEANNGGDMIESIIRNIEPTIAYESVWASRGKITRAEPIVALYQQGRVHHVGRLAVLEDEMTNWKLGDKSPNRIDALVWLVTFLMQSDKKNDFYVV